MLLLPITESQILTKKLIFFYPDLCTFFLNRLKTECTVLCKLLLFLGMCSFVYDRCSLALWMGIVHWQSGDT